EMGSDVVKLEPPEGAASRHVGPFADHAPHPDSSLNFLFYNSNKRSVIADLSAPDGRRTLDAQLADTDLLITTLQPRALRDLGLDFGALLTAHARLIVLSVTPFGLTGPWAD